MLNRKPGKRQFSLFVMSKVLYSQKLVKKDSKPSSLNGILQIIRLRITPSCNCSRANTMPRFYNMQRIMHKQKILELVYYYIKQNTAADAFSPLHVYHHRHRALQYHHPSRCQPAAHLVQCYVYRELAESWHKYHHQQMQPSTSPVALHTHEPTATTEKCNFPQNRPPQYNGKLFVGLPGIPLYQRVNLCYSWLKHYTD